MAHIYYLRGRSCGSQGRATHSREEPGKTISILLYLRVVRDEGILYIMAAERVKTVEDRKVSGVLKYHTKCAYFALI